MTQTSRCPGIPQDYCNQRVYWLSVQTAGEAHSQLKSIFHCKCIDSVEKEENKWHVNRPESISVCMWLRFFFFLMNSLSRSITDHLKQVTCFFFVLLYYLSMCCGNHLHFKRFCHAIDLQIDTRRWRKS